MKKVLLIYDVESSAQAHSRSLYYRGVYPMVSNDLEDAYNLACYGHFDLVVLDFLDDSTKIQHAIRKFKERNIKIIALMTSYCENTAQFYRSLGADEVISKPMHAREFMNHICQSLKVGEESRFSGEFAWGY